MNRTTRILQDTTKEEAMKAYELGNQLDAQGKEAEAQIQYEINRVLLEVADKMEEQAA